MRRVAMAAMIVLTVSGFAPTVAKPGLPIRAPDLLAKSDLVVAGQYSEAAYGGRVHAKVHVDRVIKGDLALSGKELDLGFHPDADAGPTKYGMFFFREAGGQVDFTDPSVFALPAAPPAFQVFTRPQSPLERVAAELATVFLVPPHGATDPNSGLRSGVNLASMPSGHDAAGKRIFALKRPTELWLAAVPYADAALCLRYLPPSVRLPYLTRVMDLHGPTLGRAWDYAAILQAGDASHLGDDVDYLMHPDEEASGTNANLMLALEELPIDERNADFFAEIEGSTNEYVREGAIYQLRDMQSAVARRALQAALRDPVLEVRISALYGVCQHITLCDNRPDEVLAAPENAPAIQRAYGDWIARSGH